MYSTAMLWWGFIIWVVCVNTSTPKTNLFLLSPHPICTIHPATLLAGWLKTPHTDKCQRDVTPYPPSPLLITRQMEKRKRKERLQSLLSQDENDLTLILPSIYLSSHRTARHLPTLHRHCIDTIITIAPTTQAPFDLERNEENREHLRIDVDDDGTFYTAPLLLYVFKRLQISQTHFTTHSILIHCVRGRSRSPTILIAYLMWQYGLSLSAAFAYVKERRPCVSPRYQLFEALQKYEMALFDLSAPTVNHSQNYIPIIVGPEGVVVDEREQQLMTRNANNQSGVEVSGFSPQDGDISEKRRRDGNSSEEITQNETFLEENTRECVFPVHTQISHNHNHDLYHFKLQPANLTSQIQNIPNPSSLLPRLPQVTGKPKNPKTSRNLTSSQLPLPSKHPDHTIMLSPLMAGVVVSNGKNSYLLLERLFSFSPHISP
jgi:predicted protein tyrosine phosphatase